MKVDPIKNNKEGNKLRTNKPIVADFDFHGILFL